MAPNHFHRIFRGSGRLTRRLVDPLPLTPLGLAVVVTCGLGLEHLAYGQMDVVLLVVGWAGLGLVGLAALAVVPAALWLKLRRGDEGRTDRGTDRGTQPLHLETGLAARTGFSLPSLAWLPLLQLRWEWERPPGVRVAGVRARGRRGRLLEEVTFDTRGEVQGVRRRLVVQDAFGLARVALRRDDPRVLSVLPAVGGLRQMPVLTSLAGGDELPHPMGLDDGDRVDLRRYVPGDPARFIHWKVYGRTRKLMVRVPERALTRSRRTVAYLVAGPDDGASAAAARVAIEHDALGGEWVFAADGAPGETSSPEEAVRQVVRSVSARDRGGAGLAAFLDRMERRGPASLVVFAPPAPGPWLERVLSVARRRRHGVRVVVGIDGLVDTRRPPLMRRLLFSGRAPRGTSAAGLDEVTRKLASQRCEVILFDRPTGRVLSGIRGGAGVRRADQGRAA